VLPTPPSFWVTSPAVPGKSSRDVARAARVVELLGIPSQTPAAKIHPGSAAGTNPALTLPTGKWPQELC